MGSLRNPVGPLPSTIYWRRRAVAATLIALLALLVVWVVSLGGGGGKKTGDTSDGANPTKTIGPGPSGSGPAISEQPGGRDDSGGSGGSGDGGTSGADAGGDGGDGGKNGDSGGSGGTGGSGSGGSDGSSDGGGSGGSSDGGGSTGSGGGTGSGSATGSTGTGRQVEAGSALPDCAPNSLTLRLATTKVAYAPGEKPAFRLTVSNTSDTSCKADFGPKAIVLTITDTDDDQVWTSKDCPKTGASLFEVPANGTVTRTVEWDRRKSTSKCATPPPGAVGPGTYLVEAKAAGATVKQGQQSIRLEKD
ncbi:hypothetical protein ACFY7Z_26395 [Streptomyces sp. NPDC012623]|uniref:hypothetical protein n=1 Tax=unclassified Streptomyces TaxID=2593676 RepID=UPI0036BAB95F